MPDPAQINRSLNTIHAELEFLRDSGVIPWQQFNNIVAQLPVRPLFLPLCRCPLPIIDM